MPSTCPIASLHVGAVEASFDGLRNTGLPQRSTYGAEADVEPRWDPAAPPAILVSHLFPTLGVAQRRLPPTERSCRGRRSTSTEAKRKRQCLRCSSLWPGVVAEVCLGSFGVGPFTQGVLTTDFFVEHALEAFCDKKSPGLRKKIAENSCYCTLQRIKWINIIAIHFHGWNKNSSQSPQNLRSQIFQESHTKFDLVLLHTADIMNVPGAALLETFWQLREVPYVEVVEELTRRSEERFRNVFTKLQAKKLMCFQK